MNTILCTILKSIRALYALVYPKTYTQYLDRGWKDPDQISNYISQLLQSDEPCMVARYGAFELETVINYLDINKTKHSIIRYIQNKENQWWWNDDLLCHLRDNAGFFPLNYDNVEHFCELMIDCSKYIDFLGSWQKGETRLKEFSSNYEKGWLQLIEPYWAQHPWTKHLENKRVLVVHPFAKLMEYQYKTKKDLLFSNKDVLPSFEFFPLVAVQSIGGDGGTFETWFDALQFMKDEMDAIEYDIALIGCGAYGLPLAAHAKKTGHKAIHLAGALQLLFGIRGKRWDNPMYGARSLFKPGTYQTLFNEHWIYPTEDLKPRSASKVENGCYW